LNTSLKLFNTAHQNSSNSFIAQFFKTFKYEAHRCAMLRFAAKCSQLC